MPNIIADAADASIAAMLGAPIDVIGGGHEGIGGAAGGIIIEPATSQSSQCNAVLPSSPENRLADATLVSLRPHTRRSHVWVPCACAVAAWQWLAAGRLLQRNRHNADPRCSSRSVAIDE